MTHSHMIPKKSSASGMLFPLPRSPVHDASLHFAQHDARDRRLGLLYFFFWLGILAYVVVSLFYFNRFVETEVL